MTLPPDLISALNLAYHSKTMATLADGEDVLLSIYETIVLWDGLERATWVLATDGECLIGMGLLHGSRLSMDVVDGGILMIEALP